MEVYFIAAGIILLFIETVFHGILSPLVTTAVSTQSIIHNTSQNPSSLHSSTEKDESGANTPVFTHNPSPTISLPNTTTGNTNIVVPLPSPVPANKTKKIASGK